MTADKTQDQLTKEALNIGVVSNNGAIKCKKCNDTGTYFFSDRVAEDCECKSEVAVCTGGHYKHGACLRHKCICIREQCNYWQT